MRELKTARKSWPKDFEIHVLEIRKSRTREAVRKQKQELRASPDERAKLQWDTWHLRTRLNTRALRMGTGSQKGSAGGDESCRLPASGNDPGPASSRQDAHAVFQSVPAPSQCSADFRGKQPCSNTAGTTKQVA